MFKNKLQKFKQNSPEYIAITLIFWGLFIIVILASLARFLGWGFYRAIYEYKKYPEWQNVLGNFILKWIEGIFILCALTKLKLWKATIINFIYVLIINIIHDKSISTILDFVYIIMIPFCFYKTYNKQRNWIYIQIGKIAVYLLFLLTYQFTMSFGLYEIEIMKIVKYNFGYAIVTVLPYKLFIVWLYLFYRRKDICKSKQTQ